MAITQTSLGCVPLVLDHCFRYPIGTPAKVNDSFFQQTFAISDAKELNPRHLEIWYTVHAAQVASLKAVHIGAAGRDIDSIARRVVDNRLAELRSAGSFAWKDVNEVFTHRLGHGRLWDSERDVQACHNGIRVLLNRDRAGWT